MIKQLNNDPRPDDSVFEIYGEFTWGKGFTSEGYEGIMSSEGDGETRLVECDVRISR
ncbi:MAG: hypothetical protein KKG70_13155 [Proteobacteria bacterium]|nr:hypothetical protein [Pseudomonadota bacterium]